MYKENKREKSLAQWIYRRLIIHSTEAYMEKQSEEETAEVMTYG